MYRVDIPITIHVEGPFITQSTVPGPYGVDAVMARDSGGRFYIAGTQVAGKLREAWEKLDNVLNGRSPELVPDRRKIKELLGEGSGHVDEDKDFDPSPKLLHLSDFVCQHPGAGEKARYRIEIDDLAGAVKKGAILVIESPFDPGETVPFAGNVTFLAIDKGQARLIREYIRSGMAWIDQMGAFASVGFGRVKDIEIGRAQCQSCPLEGIRSQVKETGFGLAIIPEGPFCIARRQTREGNLFVSKEIIPGNVIIGAISRMLERLGAGKEGSPLHELWDNLSRIRVLHALPARDCFTRPVIPPLSLIKAGKRLYDAASLDGPCLIDGRAPEFSVDWKDESDVKTRFGWPVLRRELRVRTAIDPEKGRSRDEALFAYEMIVPDGRSWLTRVDAERIEDKELRLRVLNQLAALLEPGLLGIGKSKVTAKAVILENDRVQDVINTKDTGDPSGGNMVTIMLQSPALLLCPEGLLEGSAVLDETSGHRELKKAYITAWNTLCPGLELLRFFATQRLSGGVYQHFRFRRDAAFYYPWILTEAGSVFVFKVKDREMTHNALEKWLSRGLPIPGPVREFYSIPEEEEEQWQHCPFIPQNGFGEIAVNLAVHEDFRPPVKAITPITVHVKEQKNDNG